MTKALNRKYKRWTKEMMNINTTALLFPHFLQVQSHSMRAKVLPPGKLADIGLLGLARIDARVDSYCAKIKRVELCIVHIHMYQQLR